jgi:hypothetical protein
MGVFFKFGVEVGVELSFVNALYRLRITNQLFKSYALHDWCDLNRLSNAYFDAKFKKTPFIYFWRECSFFPRCFVALGLRTLATNCTLGKIMHFSPSIYNILYFVVKKRFEYFIYSYL